MAAAGRRCVRPGVVVQAARTPAIGPHEGARVGFTVSKKVGNAVARNRARRRLRAAAAEVLPGGAASGTDYVLIGRAGTLDRPYAKLVGDLESAVERLGPARREART